MPVLSPQAKAVFFALICFFAFSVNDTCMKYLTTAGYDYTLISTVTSGLIIIVIGGFLLLRYGPNSFKPRKNPKLHILRMICITTAVYCLLYALEHLALAQFYSIVFSIPFIVAIIARFVLQERISRVAWAAIVIGFCGVYYSADPQFDEINSGILAALGVSLLISISDLCVKAIGPDENKALFPLYAQIALFCVSAPFVFESTKFFTPFDFFILIINAATYVTALTTMVYAFAASGSAAKVISFQYTQAFWGILFGFLFFSEMPTTRNYIGIAVVIAAGLFMIWHERKAGRTRN